MRNRKNSSDKLQRSNGMNKKSKRAKRSSANSRRTSEGHGGMGTGNNRSENA
jgi:hypothetical protein